MSDLTDELEEEFFEQKAETQYDDTETLDYVGVDGNDFMFHWSESTYLRLGIDHVCARILRSDADWPEYIPHEVEGSTVTINTEPMENTLLPGKKAFVEVETLPKTLEMLCDENPNTDSFTDEDEALLTQVRIATHIRNCDHRASGTLGEPERHGVNHVTYPFTFDRLDDTLEFKFVRPRSDADATQFERLVEECGGSPSFVPGSPFDVIPFQDTHSELARDTAFGLWALVEQQEAESGSGILSRLSNLV